MTWATYLREALVSIGDRQVNALLPKFDALVESSRWRPLSELKGESRYVLVARKHYHASRIRYESSARLSIAELCFRQEGYTPTHFCELPEFGGEE